jgi:hypothetical protein
MEVKHSEFSSCNADHLILSLCLLNKNLSSFWEWEKCDKENVPGIILLKQFHSEFVN